MRPPAVISLLTDFGLVDASVGACRGVLASLAPGVPVADIAHQIPPFDVARGARLLEYAVPYYPAGSIHVAVVDPGVGTTRRPVALLTRRGDLLIGPDNGLLMWASERLGGIDEAVELREEAYRLHPVSHTFHARDIFCPAAAHLASGVELRAFGPPLDPDSLLRLARAEPVIGEGELRAPVAYIANFGNCHFDVTRGDWERARLAGLAMIVVEANDWRWEIAYGETFGAVSPGEPLLLHDSFGRLCLAINQGNASTALGLALGAPTRFSRIAISSTETASD
jgi:S-adenosyl-L-methionine hydrolase (adenosine-forming)